MQIVKSQKGMEKHILYTTQLGNFIIPKKNYHKVNSKQEMDKGSSNRSHTTHLAESKD